MDWHTKLCGQSITHTGLDSLGISVESLRKTRALNDNWVNRANYYQVVKVISGKKEEDSLSENRV